jgi:glycosyltransferase involved in cell wall biosynthesis
VCRHGIDLARFTIPARTPRPGRIVSVGRLVPKKGFDTLIRACGDLWRRGIAFELVLLGGGELHDELLTLAHEQGISDRVSLLGSLPQRDVVEQLAAAEIFALSPVVLPDGDRDGIPNVLLEAMAAGVPVVATTVSGIPEVVTDGKTGRLVPPQRPDLLAGALAQLLTDPAARTRLGEAGRRHVHRHASWTSAIAPLRALLEGELARPTREPDELTVSHQG